MSMHSRGKSSELKLLMMLSLEGPKDNSRMHVTFCSPFLKEEGASKEENQTLRQECLCNKQTCDVVLTAGAADGDLSQQELDEFAQCLRHPDAGAHIGFTYCPEIATVLVLHGFDQKEKAINRRFERMTS